MSGIGDIVGGAIGTFGSAGISSYDDIPTGGLRGAAAGGGPNAYMGTGGKYGSFTPPF